MATKSGTWRESSDPANDETYLQTLPYRPPFLLWPLLTPFCGTPICAYFQLCGNESLCVLPRCPNHFLAHATPLHECVSGDISGHRSVDVPPAPC